MNNKIAVLMGGNSSERQVSLKSGAAVLEALIEKGYNAQAIDPAKDDITQLKSQGFDKAFIALHGSDGENGTIQGILDYLQIPYTGSGVQACAVGLSKHFCKVLWGAAGLPIADYVALTLEDYQVLGFEKIIEKINHLGYPVFVKPNCEGSSVGVSKVTTKDDLKGALEEAFKYDRLVLIEAFLAGDEFSVPIVVDEVYPSIRIKSQTQFYDYEAKYLLDNTEYQCPSQLSSEEETQIKRLALKAYQTIGCKGWARVDLMQNHQGEFMLLEINTSPGMTSHSLVPKSAQTLGESFPDLVVKILNNASFD